MKRFKYLNLKKIYVRLKTLHERTKQISPNPYSLFLDWILDVVQYGFVATVAILLIIKLKWLGVGISFGMLLWLMKIILRETLKTIKE